MPRKIRQPATSRQAYRRSRTYEASVARRIRAEINTAQNAGKSGLSCWELERLMREKHETVSGTLRGMEDRGEVVVVPGVFTRVPDSRNNAQVYALVGVPPTGAHQESLL